MSFKPDFHAGGQKRPGGLHYQTAGRSMTCRRTRGRLLRTMSVLCVCLSKYEIEELLHMVHPVDPHAFLTVQRASGIRQLRGSWDEGRGGSP